jgi:hypothetical protein
MLLDRGFPMKRDTSSLVGLAIEFMYSSVPAKQVRSFEVSAIRWSFYFVMLEQGVFDLVSMEMGSGRQFYVEIVRGALKMSATSKKASFSETRSLWRVHCHTLRRCLPARKSYSPSPARQPTTTTEVIEHELSPSSSPSCVMDSRISCFEFQIVK